MTITTPPPTGIWYTTLVVCACGLLSLSLPADNILVGVDDRITVDVGAGEVRTQSDPVVVKQYGTLDKTGEGKLVIPKGTLRDSTKFEMNVRGGTVEIPAEAGSTPTFSTEPSVIRSKAALWLDANVNVDMDGANVIAWRDVRETQTSTPFDYPRARSREYAAGNGYPWLGGSEGRRKVDFGAYNNGRYMAILNTGTADTGVPYLLKNLRHIFLVHEILTNSCYQLGYVSGYSPDGGVMFHPGSSSAAMNAVINSPEYAVKGVSGMFERNGLALDASTTYPKVGMQLYDWHFVGANNKSSDNVLEGLGCFSALCNGIYSGRQGGGIICEVIAFTEWLTEAERIAVAGYLMHKWGIASDATPGVPAVHVAEGASVSAQATAVDLYGEGRFAPIPGDSLADDIPVDALTNFHGTIDVPYAQAVHTREEFPVEVSAGDRIVATNAFEGIVLSRFSDQAPDTLVKESIAGATIHAIPEGVKNLDVKGGILRLTPRAWASTVAPGTNVAATIKNANFEESTAQKYLVSKFATSGTPPDATEPSYNLLFNWAGDMWLSSEGLYPYHWLQITLATGTIPDGSYCLTMRGQVYAYQTITVPETGIYELNFLAKDAQFLASGRHPVLEVALGEENGTHEGTNMTALAEVQPGYSERGWARYRYLTPRLAAGTYHLRIGNTEDTVVDEGSDSTLVDDIKLQLVSRPSTGWAVPNGDFETLTRTNALPQGPDAAAPAEAAGWTFTQGAWGTDTTYLGAFPIRYGTPFRCMPTEFRHGGTQLALIYGSSATVTFKPQRTGVYRLSMRAGKSERGSYNGVATRGSPTFTATIRQGAGEAASLGTVTTSQRTFSTLIWPTDVVFADTNTTVTLTIANTATSSSGTSIGVIDDLEFVPAHELREGSSTIVKSGREFSSTYWRFHSNKIDGVALLDRCAAGYVSNITGQYYGHNRYRSLWGAAQIIDRGALYQDVTFPAPGRYRLKWHSRARADVRDENFTRSFSYGKRSGLRVVLADGGVTNRIYECSTATTNFVGYSCTFDIADASKTYTLGFEGTNDPLVSNIKDQNCYVCDVVCDCIGEAGQTDTAMDLDPGLNVTIAAGAKLSLDYEGVNEVASVRIAGRRATGLIDAEHYPQNIVGVGALYVRPDGLRIIFR